MQYTAVMRSPIVVTGTPRSGKSVICRTAVLEKCYQWVREPLMIWNMDLGARKDDCRSALEAPPDLKERIQNACAKLLESQNNRYIDDLSYHALRIPFLHAVFPEAKIIHVVRKPEHAIPEMLYGWTYRDSVGKAFVRRRKNIRLQGLPRLALRFAGNYLSSRLRGSRKTWGPRVPDLEQFVSSHKSAEVAAFQWKNMVEIAMDDLAGIPQDNWIQVQFDALLEEPAVQGLRIGEFCGVDNPQMFAESVAKFIEPDFVFEKKVYPTETEWNAINPMIEQVRERIGFV